VDFDGDGHLDLVSGSYDPGELYLFRGQGKGTFAARETIKDKTGKPILRVPEQKHPVESFGSWLALVDWDDDSDLDIVVGCFDGSMFLRRNEGSRSKPAYAVANEWLTVGGKRLRVPGGAHANPVIADWDGDGRWDIITGSGDGGVYWYRNVGKKGRPELEMPVALVPKHDGVGYAELLDPAKEPQPGIRSQIAVADYDGDGKLDMLLGDFCTYLHLRKDLTVEDRQGFKAVQARQAAAGKGLGDCMQAIRATYAKMMQGVPQSEWHTKENMAKWQKLYMEMRESPAYKKHQAEYDTAQKDMQRYVEQAESARGGGPDVPHGFVWLFRRK
jgi:hypothetical protein